MRGGPLPHFFINLLVEAKLGYIPNYSFLAVSELFGKLDWGGGVPLPPVGPSKLGSNQNTIKPELNTVKDLACYLIFNFIGFCKLTELHCLKVG